MTIEQRAKLITPDWAFFYSTVDNAQTSFSVKYNGEFTVKARHAGKETLQTGKTVGEALTKVRETLL